MTIRINRLNEPSGLMVDVYVKQRWLSVYLWRSWHRPLNVYLNRDAFWMWLAWLLPKPLVYMAGIRLWAHATTGPGIEITPSEVKMDEAISRWEKAK